MNRCTVSLAVLVLLLQLIFGSSAADYSEHGRQTQPTVSNDNGDNVTNSQADDKKDGGSGSQTYDGNLSPSYYEKSCPGVEGIIQRKVKEWTGNDSTLAPSLIRLFFHDCVVRGCNGSILLDHEGSERRAEASKTLRGFQVIDDIKREVESKCPKKVSCADILAAAARDATVVVGGPYWTVPFGRKDGRVSIAAEADQTVPMGRESITDLMELFQSKGLNVLDLVILSGMHTIGRSACGAVQHRLYNFEGSGKPDPSINPKYLNYLRRKCRSASEYVYLDATTPRTFDLEYYKNLGRRMGLLSTDQMLYFDSRTCPLLSALDFEPSLFYRQLAVSMTNLASIQDFLAEEVEIRVNCNFVNPS